MAASMKTKAPNGRSPVGQHIRTVRRYRDRMFKMGGTFAVLRHDRRVVALLVDRRRDGQDIGRAELAADLAAFTKILVDNDHA